MTERNERIHYEQYKIVFDGPRNDVNTFQIVVEKSGAHGGIFVLFRHNSDSKDPSCGARMSLDGLEYIGREFARLAAMWRTELPEHRV